MTPDPTRGDDRGEEWIPDVEATVELGRVDIEPDENDPNPKPRAWPWPWRDEEPIDDGDERAVPLLAAVLVPGVGDRDDPKDGDLEFATIDLAVFAGSLGVESGVEEVEVDGGVDVDTDILGDAVCIGVVARLPPTPPCAFEFRREGDLVDAVEDRFVITGRLSFE
ncbi:hypothetical protein CCMSSC00406_0010320 [Pleurotus cornucopiae]|uniref:Uncharacterized protein n=1 Tax=Pleurotus cornucopiae TaxID=5321 RepID=A0ACB7IPF4_PLECO|nr:hypothetical protein CCMSSC00406_0010320 [Pleurotus cornucopiae]